jgi:hypothetical protein
MGMTLYSPVWRLRAFQTALWFRLGWRLSRIARREKDSATREKELGDKGKGAPANEKGLPEDNVIL